MAFERMPDFKEINELVSSMQALDSEFQRIVTDSAAREKQVTRSCREILKRNAAGSLAEIPVEELKNAKAGIRVSALQNAGFLTLLDLYNAENWKLRSVEGIGDKQVASIRNIIGEFMNSLSARSHIRLTTEESDKESRELIEQIAGFRQCDLIRKEAEPISGEVHSFISEATSDVRIRSPFKWIFSRRQTKEITIGAIADLLEYCRGAQYRRVKNLIDAYRKAEQVSGADALEDYKTNSASYYALIERLTGTGPDTKKVYSSIPLALAEQIDAYDLNLRSFHGDLRAYQSFGVKYILSLKRVLLGDEMGLGKTIQAIAVMSHLYAEDPRRWFLVVCPASVMINWCRELTKFSVIPVNLLHGQLLEDSLESWKSRGGAAVTNYESMGKIIDEVNERMDLAMLVIDEAHYIKNPEAKRTKYIHSLEDEAQTILMMTGTPLENKVDEMCELIGFVRPDMVGEIRRNAGMRHVPEFREMLAPVYLRRQRDMVLDELPPITIEEEWCEMTQQDRDAYSLQALDRNFMGLRRVSFLQDDMRTSSKAIRLRELCEQAADEGRKVIIYSYFRETIRKVISFLGDMVTGSVTGSTPANERQEMIDRFSRNGTVLVCQVQAGGTGLNIQAASIVIFCEPQIKPSLEWQAISRVYRMGQVQNVLVYHLLCEDSIDESVRGILAEKEAEFDVFAQESAIADAADGLADKEWIRQAVEKERQKYLPAVVESDNEQPL